MNTKRLALASTAAVAAGLFGANAALAQDAPTSVVPGGGLEVELSGFTQMDVNFGDENSNGKSRAFDTDAGFVLFAEAVDDASGVRYGGQIDIEVTGGEGTQFDEGWLFFEGGFGQFRFGSEDGSSDTYKIGAWNIAAGTGGIDGAIQGVGSRIGIENSGDATKIRYDSPVVSGFQVGISYAPDTGDTGQLISGDNDAGEYEDVFEFGATYTGSFSGLDLELSAVAGFGDAQNAGEEDLSGFQIGAQTEISGFKVAGGFLTTEAEGVDSDAFSLGVGASFGAVDTSINYSFEDAAGGEITDIVVSAGSTIMPGVFVGGDLGIADDETVDDELFGGVARVKVSF